jgi:leucyl aminopeptidase (aminopeptidase T)
MVIPVRAHHGISPPNAVLEAQKITDMTISNTSQEYHTGGYMEMSLNAGKKFCIMEQVDASILASEACSAEIHKLMVEHGPKLNDKLDKGGVWHITSESGTDHNVETQPGTGRYHAGNSVPDKLKPGKFRQASFPSGEAGVDPVRETGNGPIVIDTSIHYPAGLLKEPIKLDVKRGRIVNISGGSEAEQLKWFITTYGDENTYNCPIELSIGWNPKSPITGNLRSDKKHYGKLHVGLGRWRGSPSKLHIDGVIRKPTITIDDETFIENGVIKMPPFDRAPWV